jgi:hypothetical protein
MIGRERQLLGLLRSLRGQRETYGWRESLRHLKRVGARESNDYYRAARVLLSDFHFCRSEMGMSPQDSITLIMKGDTVRSKRRYPR